MYKNLKFKLTENERSKSICHDLQQGQQQHKKESMQAVTSVVPDDLKKGLQKELNYVQTLTDIGVKRLNEDDDLELVFNGLFFENMAREVEEKCAILKEIIQVLATGTQDDRNTGKKKPAYKFKSALHIVLALDDIKSQKSKSDFSTVFGLLLLSHGAGKALLDVLEPFGLCKGYEFL